MHLMKLWIGLCLLLLCAACGSVDQPTVPPPRVTASAAAPQNTPTTFPTPTVSPTASDTPTTTNVTEHNPALISALDGFLQQQAETGQFSGSVLIAHNGSIVLSNGYGMADRTQALPNTPQTRFRIGSITKQFTALAVLMLQERGLLDVQNPICEYLPDCPPAWQDITVHHLLVHSSGIPDFTRFPDFRQSKDQSTTPEETIARFRDEPLEFPPGSRWNYSNSNYIVLGYLVEIVSGMEYGEFLQENVFTPLGMEDSGYLMDGETTADGYRDRSGQEADFIDMTIPFAAGALFSTVEDLYRWNRGLDENTLLAADLQAQMFMPHMRIDTGDNTFYGYGWIIEQQGDRRVYQHTGTIDGFSASIGRYPDENVFIVVLGNQQDVNPNAIRQRLFEILQGKQ